MSENYNLKAQELYLQFMISDHELFSRVCSILKEEYFDRSLKSVVKTLVEHSEKYSTVPTVDIIEANTGVSMEVLDDATMRQHTDWFIDNFETFCRHKALELAIIEGADLLEDGRYGEVETAVKSAVQVGLARSMGTNFFDDPRGVLEFLKSKNGQMSSGWKSLDEKLYGGINRGEITIFAGGSGSGKSLFLQNLALNWAEAGLNVVYFTLELSEELSSMRMMQMASDVSAKEIFKKLDDVELAIKTKQKTSGILQIKYLPAGSTVNDLRAYLKELYIQTGVKIDCICVDYLDLMFPTTKKVSPDNQFIKDKYVTEEMRNFAVENNTVMVTASQLNRTSVNEDEFDHSHIAGGISKINTADNVIGIRTSTAMRERGEYQIQLMKTRSSGGVGSKISLAFDIDSLRIFDGEFEEETSNHIVDRLTPNSTVSEQRQFLEDIRRQRKSNAFDE